MIQKDFIVRIIKETELPRKKMKKASRVAGVLRDLYEAVEHGEAAQFDPKKADVNSVSLRSQLRKDVRRGYFSDGTKIISRGKEWFFVRGKNNV